MDSKKLIDLIELHDRYAIALMDHYINKGMTAKDLQRRNVMLGLKLL